MSLVPIVLIISGKTAGEKFVGYRPIKVLNQEMAEIDDISVIRDGDHLYFQEF